MKRKFKQKRIIKNRRILFRTGKKRWERRIKFDKEG